MQITINGKIIECNKSDTIYTAATNAGIDIPTLCLDTDLIPQGSCRICICEVNGKLKSSCDTKVEDKMIVFTDSTRVIEARKMNVELLLARHSTNTTVRDELLILKNEYHAKETFQKEKIEKKYENTSLAIFRDPSLCILCGKCVNKCETTQTVDAICIANRGINAQIESPFDIDLNDSSCVDCGQCTLVCPTGAIREVDNINEVKKALDDKDKIVVAQIAPSVRATIGEEFDFPYGTIVKEKLVAGLRKLGFDKVFDTDFGADLTIMEEASELISRITNKGTLPMTTSCCPSYITFMEKFYPHLLKHLSSCKSPQQMFGAVTKTYFAKKMNIDAKKLVVVSIMPCTAKKYECTRKDMYSSGYQDVDLSITTRETAKFLKQKNIDLKTIKEEEFDSPLGEATGAGVIFGTTGGVMEAALRTAYEFLTKKELKDINFKSVRGLDNFKEATIDIAGNKINVAVVHGLGNARKILDEMSNNTCKYHFVEVMACIGGCLGGGGQPIPTNNEIRLKRMKAIYKEDVDLPIRQSHKNPSIIKLYDEFLKKPLSETSHKLLHTKYTKREYL